MRETWRNMDIIFYSFFHLSFSSLSSQHTHFSSPLPLSFFSLFLSSSSTLLGPCTAPSLQYVSSWQMRPLPGRKQRCIKGTTPEGPVSQTTPKPSPQFLHSQPFSLTSSCPSVEPWIFTRPRECQLQIWGLTSLFAHLVLIFSVCASFAESGRIKPIDRTDSLLSCHTSCRIEGGWYHISNLQSD